MNNALTTLTNKLAARLEMGDGAGLIVKCKADGCAKPCKHPVSGLCGAHYKRMQRAGTLEITRRERGTGTKTSNGYIAIGSGGHKKQEHVLIVERVLGKALPTGAEVHHVNENRADNRHENLVVCPNKAYHKLLHVRMAAMDACGNPNFRKCPFCKEYDSPDRMKHNPSSRYYYHAACKQEYRKARSAQA